MFTNIEMQGEKGNQLIYVRLTIEGDTLVLKSLTGSDRGKLRMIPLNEIEKQVFDNYFGGQRWSFEYLGVTWKIFEYGTGLFSYIQKNLQLLTY
ncbi:hypothetical protein C6N01_13435 [Enterococcus faecalis]|uniref:hypothetical protein n=1 Tax=Enterococcus faecalis TaxID=1351 RepID=UPI00136259F0|nr:hypothetical protein [Enterococcus faecalis]NBJ47206.1 hypothetical protein [Enterococcus faecalis]